MRDTSSIAYAGIQQSGKAATQRQQVYNFLLEQGVPMTRQELSKAMGINVNAICPRINELSKADRIDELPRRKCNITGAQAHPLAVMI